MSRGDETIFFDHWTPRFASDSSAFSSVAQAQGPPQPLGLWLWLWLELRGAAGKKAGKK